jgi:glycosyltransferase involved in cell wall biosynthesis
MNLSLIITTFNWPQSLELTLKSIANQSFIPNEIIIADDGSNDNTLNLIKSFQSNSTLNIIHSWQEDKGFRAARSRNKAISQSSGEYIIFIDGDMILHPEFIKDHVRNSESGHFIQGSRVLLTKSKSENTILNHKINFSFLSNGLRNRKNAIHSNLLSKFFVKNNNNLKGIKSCNFSLFKKDCLNVNGFNNEIEGWGREDSEFAARLINNGIKRKNIHFNAIQFHLWHTEVVRLSLERNSNLLEQAINSDLKRCKNGLNSLDENEN